MARRAGTAVSLWLVLTFVVAASAVTADAGPIQTTTCAGKTPLVWKAAYRLYWSDDAARTTDTSVKPQALAAAQAFADALGTDSACALAISIDVYDMGSSSWPAVLSRPAATFQAPPDFGPLAQAGNYDLVVYRYPRSGLEDYAGLSSALVERGPGPLSFDARYPYTVFPVDAQGRSYATDAPGDPWHLLMLHEFLHQVVGFYDPTQGWPLNDVHGACDHDAYKSLGYACGVAEPYFADMLQGKVVEASGPKGMLPADVTRDGTPRDPVRRSIHSVSVTTSAAAVAATMPAGFEGTFTLRLLDAQRNVVASAQNPGGSSTASVSAPAGTYTQQTSFDGSAALRPVTIESSVTIPAAPPSAAPPASTGPQTSRVPARCRVPKLTGKTLTAARRTLTKAGCKLGRIKRTSLPVTGTWRVLRQTSRPGTQRRAGATVGVTLRRR